MRHLPSSIFHLLLLTLLALPTLATAADLTLTSPAWTLTIDPATLSTQALLPSHETLTLSAPTPARPAEIHSHTPTQATWTRPDAHLTYTARLVDDDTLQFDITAAAPTTITFPVLTPPQTAYLLPIAEGLRVPPDDPVFAAYLRRESPLTTTAGLSIPFLATQSPTHTITYLLLNPYNNALTFDNNPITATLAHTVPPPPPRHALNGAFSLQIHLGPPDPLTPARFYRNYLQSTHQFVSYKDKIARTPGAEKLLGAAHCYLWGDSIISHQDIKDPKTLAIKLLAHAAPAEQRLYDLLTPDQQKFLATLPDKKWIDHYDQSQLADALDALLQRPGITPALLHDTFPALLAPTQTWGDGYSLTLLDDLKASGLDRLWLGSPTWTALLTHPQFIKQAIADGYLIAPYDSFHSTHAPTEPDSWETAQFGQPLYETGPITNADGSKRKGFKQKGYLLSPLAAEPAVHARVTDLMSKIHTNSWFIDCDAFGEVFDDYSPTHPATQSEDAAARLARMSWIRDTFHAVIGSEGGSAYAAPVIHFAHGIQTPVLAWGDPDLYQNKSSPYFLGRYYPPNQPTTFFKTVPIKPDHFHIYFDPRFRLPLYETVFHDSVIATHEFATDSLKFQDPHHTRELEELLYQVPPLYHLNREQWPKRKPAILAHYHFFSPLQKQSALLPLTDFQYLTPDHQVQQTTFGQSLQLTANFTDTPCRNHNLTLPPHSISATNLLTHTHITYTPD